MDCSDEGLKLETSAILQTLRAKNTPSQPLLIKSHFKAPGLYNLKGVWGGLINGGGGGLYPGGLISGI